MIRYTYCDVQDRKRLWSTEVAHQVSTYCSRCAVIKVWFVWFSKCFLLVFTDELLLCLSASVVYYIVRRVVCCYAAHSAAIGRGVPKPEIIIA
jgi:hypothetical protein